MRYHHSCRINLIKVPVLSPMFSLRWSQGPMAVQEIQETARMQSVISCTSALDLAKVGSKIRKWMDDGPMVPFLPLKKGKKLQ